MSACAKCFTVAAAMVVTLNPSLGAHALSSRLGGTGSVGSQSGHCRGLPAAESRQCARQLIVQGDALYRAGALDDARAFWSEATVHLAKPDLLAAIHGRLSLQQPGATLTPLPVKVVAVQTGSEASARESVSEDVMPSAGASVGYEDARAGRHFGLGLGAGYDGVASVILAWMPLPYLSVEASIGLLYPCLDTRLRFFGPTGRVAPLVGLGVLSPFGDTPLTDLKADLGVSALFEYGTTLHIDMGVSYAAHRHLELSGGVSLMTTLSREVSPLLFFPYGFIQAIAYF